MKVTIITLGLLVSFVLKCSAQVNEKSMAIANSKDSQTEKMVYCYLKNNRKNMVILFPQYKKFLTTLNEIRSYSKSKNFGMRPNYLPSLQGDKTIIILSVSKPNNDIVSYKVTFTSGELDSKIESIRHEPKFDQKAEKEVIIMGDDSKN